MDLNKPELAALRDYLEAVKASLLSSGSSVEDYLEIEGEICAHVANQLGEAPYSAASIAEVVRGLDEPFLPRERPDCTVATIDFVRSGCRQRPWPV